MTSRLGAFNILSNKVNINLELVGGGSQLGGKETLPGEYVLKAVIQEKLSMSFRKTVENKSSF